MRAALAERHSPAGGKTVRSMRRFSSIRADELANGGDELGSTTRPTSPTMRGTIDDHELHFRPQLPQFLKIRQVSIETTDDTESRHFHACDLCGRDDVILP